VDNSYAGADRRKNKRVRVSLSVIYRVNEPVTVRLLTANKEIKAIMLDLSPEGMSISTDYEIPVATILVMRFSLFKVEKEDVSFYGPVEITGEVKYNNKEDGQMRLGIEFVKIDEEDKRQIANFARMAQDMLQKGQK
jgi:c-di-GMP-binding flagellar brake protein YcgR